MAPVQIALYYRVFFLYVEPFSALLGAVSAALYPNSYLALTEHVLETSSASASASASTGILPLGIHVSLRQLANMYFLFTLNEALILRITSDQRVWRLLLLNLAIADIGHLLSVAPLGPAIYYDMARWNAIDWGNVPFVYMGLTSRICFLMGLGIKAKKE